MVTCKKPKQCSPGEIEEFKKFVLAGGEVDPVGLQNRIASAEFLIFFLCDITIKGVAAVKNPSDHYKTNVFSKSQASENASSYQFELGWIYLEPSVRGKGYSHHIVQKAVTAARGGSLFATSRSDNLSMHNVLEAHGFRRHGEQYPSGRGEHDLVLFLHISA